MQKKDIPQDPSALNNVSKEICYVLDEKGKYVTGLSTGWEVKATALDLAWDDIRERANNAKERAQKGEVSPILYFMEMRLMDLGILASYTGFWKWQIKRHMNPDVFNKLSEKRLKKYAEAFDVSVENLRAMKIDEQ